MHELYTYFTAVAEALPDAILFDGGRYLIATLAMSAVLFFVERSRWRVRRLQTRRAGRADYIREMLTSARSVLVYGLVGAVTIWMARHGWTAIEPQGHTPMPKVALFVLLMLIGHDAYFYWTHRAMHHPRLFKAFHRTHHLSTTPTPFAAYAFDWTEAFVQAVFVSLWAVLVPTPGLAFFIFLGVMIIRNVWGHCGVELHPRGMADHPIFGLLTTTTHHDLHHSGGYRYNYGLYFTWWDRMMGTEHPRYRQVFREVTERMTERPARARLAKA